MPKRIAKAAQRPTLDARRVIGATGLKAWGGRVSEEWDPALMGTRAIRLYREMADSEPILATVLRMITTVLQQADVYAEPADDSALAVEASDFLDECLADMAGTWEDLLADAVTMIPYGWAYLEIVAKYRRGELPPEVGPSSRYSDGKLGWDRIEIRAQDSLYRWEMKPDGTLLGMWQLAPPTYKRVFIPLEKALHLRLGGEKQNPEGKSGFRGCKRPYLFKRNLEEIEAVGIERDLAGLPVLEAPPEYMSADASPEDKAFLDAIFKSVQDIRRDEREAVLVPSETYTDPGNGEQRASGWKLKLLTSGGSRQVNASAVIERYEHRMLMTFLAEFLLLGSGGAGGSYALAKDKSDFLVLSLTATLNTIFAAFNRQAVSRLMRWNGYPSAAWPKLCHGDIESPALTELATYVTTLISAGAIVPDDALERHMRQTASLPQLGEGQAVAPTPRPAAPKPDAATEAPDAARAAHPA